MSIPQESTLIEPSRSTSPDAPPFGDSFNLNHSLQISSPPLDSSSSRDTSFHVPSLVVMRDVLDTPSSLSSPPVFDTRGFEYTSAKEITVFKWAFETIQNNLVSSGLVIEPRDRPLDFQVVDILAQPVRVIGYIQVILLDCHFRITLLPKGIRHTDELLSKTVPLANIKIFQYVLNRAFWRRIVFNIPFSAPNAETLSTVKVIRRMRFNYAMLYWHQRQLQNLTWKRKAGTKQAHVDIQYLLNFRQWDAARTQAKE